MRGEATAGATELLIRRYRADIRLVLAFGLLLALSLLAGITTGAAPAGAALPGINGKLFCVEAPPGQDQEIFSVYPDGSDRRLVTDNTFIDPANPISGAVNDSFPSVSPDGRKVAFTSNRDGTLSLYLQNADGSGLATRLTSPEAPAFGDLFSSWSPDGKILFTRLFPGGNGEIFVMNADGSNQVNLTNRATQEVNPAVSPDGRKILFHSNRNFAPTTAGDFDIYSMDRDGSNVQNLTNNSAANANDIFANWSPDGREFVFERTANDFSFSNIYRMNADGTGTPTQLTFATSGLNRNPVWSPDGTRISFDSIRDTPAPPALENREVYTMRTDGSDVRRVTNAPGSDSDCDWQTIARPTAAPRRTYPLPTASSPFADCPTTTANVVRGSALSDRINGTPRADRIFAGAGNDVVDGLAADDCIDLGPGTDRGQGGDGGDLMLGGLGGDRIAGNRGDDRLRGGSSGDRLIGGFGNDRMHGQSGSDRINGERGRDRINGGSSNDVISAGSSGDRVAGDQGGDRINGNSGNDSLSGNSGRDRISGSTGRDRIGGNSGNDRINARDGQRDRVNCGTGRDTVIADRIDRVSGNCERVRRR